MLPYVVACMTGQVARAEATGPVKNRGGSAALWERAATAGMSSEAIVEGGKNLDEKLADA